MTLRTKFYCYLVLVHCFPFALGIVLLLSDNLFGFFAVEALMLVSLSVGFVLINKASDPAKIIQLSKEVFRDHNFSSRLKPSGMAELDELIHLFNEMLEQLHQEQLKLGEQRGFYDKLLQATPIGLVVFDFDDFISAVNPAAEMLIGRSAEQMKHQSLNDIESPLIEAINESLNNLPALINLPTGSRYRVQSSSFIDRGFRRRFLMLEELTSEMRETERSAYENLIRMTSHEVNNTIGATNSLLQGCESYCTQLPEKDQGDFRQALEVIITRNSRLSEFMQRLAQVVHIPAPQYQITDLKPLLKNIRAIFSIELQQRNIVWEVQFDTNTQVNVDPYLFEQVLINIIKNGYEAIDRNGYLKIQLSDRERKKVLQIIDSAGTLDKINKNQLFQPFYTTKKQGQGIGLMLVREILNLHGFHYSLTCEPNQYTCFQIEMGE